MKQRYKNNRLRADEKIKKGGKILVTFGASVVTLKSYKKSPLYTVCLSGYIALEDAEKDQYLKIKEI